MFIELWERVRGYDKWVAANAKIESSQVTGSPIVNRSGQIIDYSYRAGDVITWSDPTGATHSADFDVNDQSPLYQYIGGESVPIRYDPADPDRFYYRDLLRTRVSSAIRATLTLLVILAVLAGWFLAATSGHR